MYRKFVELGEGLVMLKAHNYTVLGATRNAMIQRAITWMISSLQYERHQARKHGCNVEAYDKEIEEYKQLKELVRS